MAKAKKMPSGNYRVLEYVGKDVTKSGYKSFTAPTKKEAEFRAKEYKRFSETKRSNVESGKMLLKDAITEYIKSRDAIISPTTKQGYDKHKRLYFQGIMNTQIGDLDSKALQAAVNDECKRISKYTGRPLSPKTIKEAFSLITASIRMHYKDADIDNVTLPQKRDIEYDTPDRDHIIQILKAVEGDKLEIPVLLAVWLSMSMSEIRGLKWTDVKDNYIAVNRSVVTAYGQHIEKEPKTPDRKRKIPLPEHIKQLLDNEPRTSEYIVTLTARGINMRFLRMLRREGIPHCRFHDLRHAAASVMHLLNVPDKYVMKRGGWRSDRVMKKIYTQTFSKHEIIVANQIDNYYDDLLKEVKTQHEIQHENK